MADKFKWGIIGTGHIAKKFATGLQAIPDAELRAVGSRRQQTADAFGKEYGATKCYPSYDELVSDPDVDAVYVSTPHPMHREDTIRCLEAGKPVLCEKPFTVNADEAREVVSIAREKNLFVMEAMWTRFIPAVVKLRDLLKSAVIGEVRMFEASFGFRAPVDEAHRLLNPKLAGGALLDVGVYPISFAYMVYGAPPSRITSTAHLGPTGVDEQSAYLLAFGGGGLAVLAAAVQTQMRTDAVINGTEGMITIADQFWKPTRLIVSGKKEETFDIPFESTGLNYQAQEVARCVREGKTESDIMPLDETIQIMETTDTIREQWGLVYPTEK